MDRMKLDNGKESLMAIVNSRFKHYPPRDENEIRTHENIREIIRGCAIHLIDALPENAIHSREFSQVLTNLEDAMYHCNAAYARNKAYDRPETDGTKDNASPTRSDEKSDEKEIKRN